MKTAGTDAARLRDAIEQTKNYVGVSGIYNIAPQDHNGLSPDSMIIVQVQGGKWKLIY
jgi:branched-chain amino acid transport system substrate-binding protein